MDKMAKTPQMGIRLSPKRCKNPIISVAVDGEANLRAGRATVTKYVSVPKITAVLSRPTREAGQTNSSLPVHLSQSRRAHLLEHFEQVKFVPAFYELSILNVPDVYAPKLDGRIVRRIAHE